MKAIPKKLLIHTVTLSKKKDVDRWGKTMFENKHEIMYVRMEPTKQITRDKNNSEIQLSAILFFDCMNSRPRNIEFAVDDIVVFNDEIFQIKVIEPLYDEKRLHHYELGLIKSV